MADYSGSPLAKKLGIRAGTRVGSVTAPDHFPALLAPLPEGVELVSKPDAPVEVVVVFATRRDEMDEGFRTAMERIPAHGAIWTAWPKRGSGMETDLDGNIVREMILPTGLVDNKIAAIDETWTGMRFVVRLENRDRWNGERVERGS